MPDAARSVDKLVGDLLDAAAAGAEIVTRGKQTWDADRLLRLAGEAVINRIGDAATKLPSDVRADMAAVPWDDIRANRVLVAHVYHRIDPDVLWATLYRDVPALSEEVQRWRDRSHRRPPGRTLGPDAGLGL